MATTSYDGAVDKLRKQADFTRALEAQKGIQNQSSVFKQMQGVANGTGPNPVLDQLANTTGQNTAQQAALMAGQRGASANAGLLARQAALQGGAIQQNAAGQAAALESQQRLNALNQLGSIAGQQVNQQQSAVNSLTQNQLNQEQLSNQAILGQNSNNIAMQSNINNVNAGLSSGNAQRSSDMVGGLLNGAGAALSAYGGGGKAHGGSIGFADGGMIPATGGVQGPSSFAARYFQNLQQPQQQPMFQAPRAQASNQGAYNLGKGLGSLLNTFRSHEEPTASAPSWGSSSSDYKSMPNATPSWGSSAGDYANLPNQDLNQTSPLLVNDEMPAADAGMSSDYMQASHGGKVPGKARVFGDSSVNDTVPAKLSPGEIVIPRSILQGKNPVKMAAKFVEQELLKQHKTNFADGGTAATQPQPQNDQWADRWSKMAKGVRHAYADGGTAEEQKPVVVNVNNGPSDPAADFYAQRQAALEAKNPGAYAPESSSSAPPAPATSQAAQFYAHRNEDMAAGVPYTPGLPPTAPIVPGQPGPALASNSTVASPMMGGEMGAAPPMQPPVTQAVNSLMPPPAQPQNLQQSLLSAANEQKAGLRNEAKAFGDQGRAENEILQAQQAKIADQQKTYQDSLAKLDSERKAFQDDILNQRIDPNRYIGNQSTVQKVSTAIGLILGGMGGGLTHQENPALKFLNNQIDNDIKSQQADLGKKENLLSMNMAQSKNLGDAIDRTRMMMNDTVSSQLKAAAAKAQDPLAKARALQAAGKIDSETATSQQQYALNVAKNSGAQAENYIPTLGVYATSKEGAAKLNELAGATRSAQAGINDLLKLTNKTGKSLSPEQRAEADTIANTVRSALRVPILGPGTVNDSERALLNRIVSNPATVFSLDNVSRVRLNALSKRLDTNLSQTARAYQNPATGGQQAESKFNPIETLSGDERRFAEWAMRNPDDKQAQRVKKRLGL